MKLSNFLLKINLSNLILINKISKFIFILTFIFINFIFHNKLIIEEDLNDMQNFININLNQELNKFKRKIS